MKFETIESQRLFTGRAIKLWLEIVLYPDGRQIEFEVIRHPGAVTILPVDEDDQIWFVRQYRHPAGQLLLELPAGTLEAGEPPEDTAKRELQEEIGMAAETLIPLGGFYMAPGYSTEFMHCYLASGLTASALEQDEAEYIRLERYSIEEAYRMFTDGEIIDGKTLAVLAMARPHLLPG